MITFKRVLLFIALKCTEIGALILGFWVFCLFLDWMDEHLKLVFLISLVVVSAVIALGVILAIIALLIRANWEYVKRKIR